MANRAWADRVSGIGRPLMAATALVAVGAAVIPALAANPAGSPAKSLTGVKAVPAASVRGIKLVGTDGKSHTLGELAAPKATVVAFIGVDCPISNSYVRPLTEMASRFEAKGARFVGVNATPADSLKQVAGHAKEYRLGFPVWKDERQALADALGVRVTPEVFLLDVAGKVQYRGRIDDSYASRTRKNATVSSKDLEAALEAVLAGRPVAKAETQAFGCAIVRQSKVAANAGTTAKVTYHRDVLPILQNRCQSCHRPGQVAPFSLLTYADAKSWATEIKEFTGNRQMPPWLAEPGHGEFSDVRRMSDEELKTLADWADAGAPEGKASDARTARTWSDEWLLGKPDLVLEMPESFTVPATGDDLFQVFVLKTGLTEDKQVVALDFKPGNSRVVHHVVSFVDTSGAGRKLDEKDPNPGYESGAGGVKVPTATIQGVWAPGNLPRFLPKGVGRPLSKNGDILIQMHYHKTGKEEVDRTKVALYFAKEPMTRVAMTTIVGPFSIDIPAGAANHEEKMSFRLPIDMEVLNIMPHMHLLGKEMKVTAKMPDGTEKSLVWIKNWDYRWQDSYRYKEPLLLPRGTQISLSAFFDNSSANPRNPSNPPKRVRFGEQTTDEMGFAIMEVVRAQPAR